MPFKLRKVRNEPLYRVYNTDTKRSMSYAPLDKETATKQLIALHLKYGEEYKEKIFKAGMRRYPKGSQEAKDAMSKARKNKKKPQEAVPSVPEPSKLS